MSTQFKTLRCTVYGLLLLIFVCVFLWWNFAVSVPLKIGKETTVLTEPRTEDGTFVDYVAYFRSQYPAEMKTEKNAVRELVRILGDLNEASADAEMNARMRAQLFEGLGLEETLKAEFTLEHVRKAFGNDELDTTDPALPASEAERARAWVAANSPALDAVVEAVNRAEICAFPLVLFSETLFDTSQGPQCTTWVVACDLIFRANWRITQGDTEGALSDVLACRKLGKMMRGNHRSAREFYWAMRIEGEAQRVPFAANPEAPLTAEQWSVLADSFAADSRLADARACLEGYETCALLDILHHDLILKKNSSWELEWPWICHSRLGMDWNVFFKQFQKHWKIDREFMLTGDAKETMRNDYKYLGWPRKFRLSTRYLRSDFAARVALAHLGFCDLGIQFGDLCRCDCGDKLVRIECAIQRYRLAHSGALPPAFHSDAAGKPLHSWRVLLLPYLGEQALFDQIRLEEPWDSEWNARFHAQMPDVFADSQVHFARECKPGTTTLTWLPDAPEGILVTESTNFHNWMAPDPDLEKDDDKYFIVLTATGEVRHESPE